jgi:hypothetical protein
MVKKNVADEIAKEGTLLVASAASETVSVKIKANGEYVSWGIELMHSRPLQAGEVASEVIDDMMDALELKVQDYRDSKLMLTDDDLVPEVQVEEEKEVKETTKKETKKKEKPAPEPEPEPEEVDPPDEPVDEDAIRNMDREDLIEIIEQEELEIDPKAKEYKKTSALAEAIIEILFADEEEAEGEEVELTEEVIREMERKELVDLIEEKELDIKPKDFKKTSDLAEAVIEALDSGDGSGEGGDDEFGDFDNVS